jgi:hypothetical protein
MKRWRIPTCVSERFQCTMLGTKHIRLRCRVCNHFWLWPKAKFLTAGVTINLINHYRICLERHKEGVAP